MNVEMRSNGSHHNGIAYKVVTGSTMYVGRVNTTKAHIHQSKEMYNTKQTNKLKPGLVASYNIRPGNGEGLLSYRRIINLSLSLHTYLDTYPLTYSPGRTSTEILLFIVSL